MEAYRIILADDHTLFRQGVRQILKEDSSLSVVGEVSDGRELMEMLQQTPADLVLLDLSMPNLGGLEASTEIKDCNPQIKILLLTMHRDTGCFRHAVSSGVEGYLLKEDADTELFSAIRILRGGGTYVSPILAKDLSKNLMHIYQMESNPEAEPLTARQREILTLIANGKSSREIGNILNISTRTVQNHRAGIMKKLNAKGTADLVKYAILKGFSDT